MSADLPYFVLLFLIALIINTVFHVVTLLRDRRKNAQALIQTGVAFVLGFAMVVVSQHGVLYALHPGDGPTVLDGVVTGLVLAAATDNIGILQTLGDDVPKEKGPDDASLPQSVEVSGQIRVNR